MGAHVLLRRKMSMVSISKTLRTYSQGELGARLRQRTASGAYPPSKRGRESLGRNWSRQAANTRASHKSRGASAEAAAETGTARKEPGTRAQLPKLQLRPAEGCTPFLHWQHRYSTALYGSESHA